jgi:hypothetical protein
MDKYIWLIPLLPLAGFVINGLGRNTPYQKTCYRRYRQLAGISLHLA